MRILLLAPALWLASCSDSLAPAAPVPETGGPTAAKAAQPFVGESVVAGEQHGCALTLDGTAYCWGQNRQGQLGDGTTTASASPVKVVGGLRFEKTLTSGGNHTCALTRQGKAYCWGWNASGQLGDGTTLDSSTPVAVSGGRAFRDIAAGWTHSCAVDPAGAAHCWGRNDTEQLGTASGDTCTRYGAGRCSTTPVAVQGGISFASLSVGMAHNCGVATDGTAYCWGWNVFGQLGDGTLTNRRVPTPIPGAFSFASISSGAGHSCGVLTSGAARCWGFNYAGNLGNGTTNSSTVPVAVEGGISFASISASTGNNILTHTCGIATSGETYCWGSNMEGQLGSTLAAETCTFRSSLVYTCSTTPVAVSGGPRFLATDLGNAFTCGQSRQRQIHCWGTNGVGQLGTGTPESRSAPAPIAPPERGRTAPHGSTAPRQAVIVQSE